MTRYRVTFKRMIEWEEVYEVDLVYPPHAYDHEDRVLELYTIAAEEGEEIEMFETGGGEVSIWDWKQVDDDSDQAAS